MQESTEPIEESDEAPSASTTKKQTASPWKHQSEETYRKTAEKLVHFSSKTVNSNASAAGIRLSASDGLDLPYVSARTLIHAGVELELDYAEGGAAQAGIIKQIMACRTSDPFADAASPEEKANYDESALCRCMGRLMLALAACWAVIALSAVFDAMILLWVGLALFFLTVVTGVIYRNTSKTVRRK